jgi:hypothetical protein
MFGAGDLLGPGQTQRPRARDIVSVQTLAVQHAAATSGYVVALIVLVVLIVVIVGVIAVLDVKQKRSAAATGDAVDVAGPWYRQYGARFRRRARLVLTLDAEGAGPDGEVVTASTDPTVGVRISVGLTSDADAGQTTMTVLVPRGCDAQWVDARTPVEPEPTTELLGLGDEHVPVSGLTKVLAQVGRGDNPVAILTMTVRVPPRGEGAARIPIRFRASAENLGVDEAPVIDRVFSVRRS